MSTEVLDEPNQSDGAVSTKPFSIKFIGISRFRDFFVHVYTIKGLVRHSWEISICFLVKN